MGLDNYLNESDSPSRPRRRGQYTTSADLLIAYEDQEGLRHGLLLESKYGEHYETAKWVTDRASRYSAAFNMKDSPIDSSCVSLESLLIEPFYQHLRQQLLARAMERAHELGFVTVSVLHVSPASNQAYHKLITPPELAGRGTSVSNVWQSLLSRWGRYVSWSYEAAFRAAKTPLEETVDPSWLAYQDERYRWTETCK